MGILPWEPPLEKNRKKSQANKDSYKEKMEEIFNYLQSFNYLQT